MTDRGKYLHVDDDADNDDRTAASERDTDYLKEQSRKSPCFCPLTLAPGRQKPCLVMSIVLDLVLLVAASWTIVNIISQVPSLSDQPPQFWAALGVTSIAMLSFLIVTATRCHNHYVLLRMFPATARRKMAIWSTRLVVLALFHALASVWLLASAFIIESVGNATSTRDNDAEVIVLEIRWTLSNVPFEAIFGAIVCASTVFDILTAFFGNYRSISHIRNLVDGSGGGGGDVSMQQASQLVVGTPTVFRSAAGGTAAAATTAMASTSTAGTTNGTIPWQGDTIITSMRKGIDPFTKESTFNSGTQLNYSSFKTLSGTDDEGRDSPRSVEEQLDAYEEQTEADAQSIVRVKGARPQRAKKVSTSKTQTIRHVSRGDNGSTGSGVRASLDDSRPGRSGADGMY